MDVREQLALLSQAAIHDDYVSAGTAAADGRGFFAAPADGVAPHRDVLPCVSHLTAPDGQRRAILKILQTSACQNNCNYCAFRAGRDLRRAHVTPDDLARSFDLMYRAGLVEGLFLSSGVVGNRGMDEMIETVELVRTKYAFRGYVHLKLLPGADSGHVEAAVRLADRVSANLEAPTPETLTLLAPVKQMPMLVGPLEKAARWRRALRQVDGQESPSEDRAGHWGNARIGLSTQFVVGPAGETDRELLGVAQQLYRDYHLSRTYYSAFTPVARTPLENAPPTDPRREHRLYQADWLLRFYGFSADELHYDGAGLLRPDLDPKVAWARAHPERFPIDVNVASLRELLRIPGVGLQSAQGVIAARRVAPLRETGDLRRLGARAEQAVPYILFSGRRPPHQPPLPLDL